ncbi:hypothetical protein [Streptacidiphilus sp. EB103A]|uniref:hypothetical protein n=1 Tax=Streptacidiphilus sp. EB103A TaxID=3156275 RepID=UPI0035137658
MAADAALWRSVPTQVRRALQTAELVEEIRRLEWRLRGTGWAMEWDLDAGWAGRPRPTGFSPAPSSFGGPCRTSPSLQEAQWTQGYGLLFADTGDWLRSASVTWTGNVLVLVDGAARRVTIPLADKGAQSASSRGARPVELVLLSQDDPLRPGRRQVSLLVLNADGRRLLTMPGLGLPEDQVREIASAARLDFRSYTLTTPWDLPGGGIASRIFPPARGHQQLRFSPRS